MKHVVDISNVLDATNDIPGALWDIGVGQAPHTEALQFQERYPHIDIIGLEPQNATYLERSADFPGRLYPWGLSDKSEILTLHRTKCRGNSSTLAPGKFLRRELTFTGKEHILCTTLDELDSSQKHPKDIFLWMDIEGAELKALQGGPEVLASGRIRWINLEASYKPRRIGEPSRQDLEKVLLPLGYRLVMKHERGRRHISLFYQLES